MSARADGRKVETQAVFNDPKDYKAVKQPLNDIKLLSEEDIQLFTHPDLLLLALTNQFSPEDLAKALAHLCYGNEKQSKKLSAILLQGIVSNDYERIRSYLEVVEELVAVKEKDGPAGSSPLQQKRLEWIFGIGLLNFFATDDHVKLGLEYTTHSIKTEIVNMKSMVGYNPDADSSLLQLLWRYHGNMDKYTVNCLEHLLEIIANDEDIQEFFSKLPGITYLYARYTDWIKPYLQSQLNSTQSGYSKNATNETLIKLISQYEIYEGYLYTKDKALESQKDPVVTKLDFPETASDPKSLAQPEQPSTDKDEAVPVDQPQEDQATEQIDSTKPQAADEPEKTELKILTNSPESFIILRSFGQGETVENMEHEGLVLDVSALDCSWCYSKPNGSANLAVPEAYLNKYVSKTSDGRSAAAMLKQRDQLAQGQGTAASGARARIEDAKNSEFGGKEPQDTSDAVVIRDADEQWEVMEREDVNANDADGEDGYVQDNEGDDKTGAEEGKQEEVVEAPQVPPAESGLDSSFEDWEGEPINRCGDLVYRISLTNTTDKNLKYKIDLKDKGAADVNLSWPRTGFKGQLGAGKWLVLAVLPKLVPSAKEDTPETAKLEWKLSWKEDMSKKAGSSATDKKGEGKNTGGVSFNDKVDTVGASTGGVTSTCVGPDAGDFASEATSNPYEIQCPFCTIWNPKEASICSMCLSTLS